MASASAVLFFDAIVWIIAGVAWSWFPDAMNRRLNNAEHMDAPLEDMTRGFGAALAFGGATQFVIAPFMPVLVAALRLTFVLVLLFDLALRYRYAVLATPKMYGLVGALVLPCAALIRASVGTR